jgi:hypothetical protein
MNTLFELRTDEDLRREAIADNANRVHDVLRGLGPWPLSERQRKLLECLRGKQGRHLAMTIDELMQRVGSCERKIKSDIRELVTVFKLPIVASRNAETGGYYFPVTAEERIAGTADYIKEIVALAERVRIIRGVADLSTLYGQLPIKLSHSERTSDGK